MGPCLCGDPYCPFCGSADAGYEDFEDAVIEKAGIESHDDYEGFIEALAKLEIYGDEEQSFILAIIDGLPLSDLMADVNEHNTLVLIERSLIAFRKAVSRSLSRLNKYNNAAEDALKEANRKAYEEFMDRPLPETDPSDGYALNFNDLR